MWYNLNVLLCFFCKVIITDFLRIIFFSTLFLSSLSHLFRIHTIFCFWEILVFNYKCKIKKRKLLKDLQIKNLVFYFKLFNITNVIIHRRKCKGMHKSSIVFFFVLNFWWTIFKINFQIFRIPYGIFNKIIWIAYLSYFSRLDSYFSLVRLPKVTTNFEVQMIFWIFSVIYKLAFPQGDFIKIIKKKLKSIWLK